MVNHEWNGGGHEAAVLMKEEWSLPGRRVWLVPLVLLLLVLAPLLREGIPATQVGALPLFPALTSDSLSSARLYEWLGYKFSLFFLLFATTALIAWLARSYWEAATAWWVASLWLVMPLTISLLYQRGRLPYLEGTALLLLGLVGLVQLPGRRRRGARAMIGIAAAVALAWGGARLWSWEAGLEPAQLFSSAWPSPDKPREWVGALAYQLGLAPLVLATLAAWLAWQRREEQVARRALLPAAVAVVSSLFALLGGPVLLYLVVATVALLLASGGLPRLQRQYGTFPALLGLLVAAALNGYPLLQPAWLHDLPAEPGGGQLFGENELLLLDLKVSRAGEQTTVVVLWQALGQVRRDYTAFVHLLDESGEMVGQADTLLLDGEEVPSSRWPTGYVVRQHYQTESPSVPAQLRIGLYDRESLQRLPIQGGSDHLVVPIP